MKTLLDGAMELPMDKYRIRIDELEEELAREKAKAEEERAKAETAAREIERLKQQLQELGR